MNDISAKDRLDGCESRMERGLASAAKALREIQQNELYREAGFSNFVEYCEQRWNYSKTYGYKLIGFADFRDRLKEDGVDFLPDSPSVAGELMRLKDDDKQSLAWKQAVDTAPERGGVPHVTAQHVKDVLTQHYGLTPKSHPAGPSVDKELATALQALLKCRALKKSGEDFAEKYGTEKLPKNWTAAVDWLMALASVG